jgi:predicted aspartyl protease
LVPVEVNGSPTTFLLDTGTTHTIISKEFADRIGIHIDSPQHEVPIEIGGPGATQIGHVAALKSFRMGSINAKRNSGQVLVVDLSSLFTHVSDGVTGLLGNATWFSADYVLDAERPSFLVSRRLGLSESPDSLRLKSSGGSTYLPVEIEGQSFDFLLDTGAGTTRVTQEVIDKLRPVNYDYVELEITTMGSTEYKKLPALHAEVKLGQVHIPQFTFLIGKENVIGLNLLRYGELSVSARDGMFIFRGHEGP